MMMMGKIQKLDGADHDTISDFSKDIWRFFPMVHEKRLCNVTVIWICFLFLWLKRKISEKRTIGLVLCLVTVIFLHRVQNHKNGPKNAAK
jgi:hypothetical protein